MFRYSYVCDVSFRYLYGNQISTVTTQTFVGLDALRELWVYVSPNLHQLAVLVMPVSLSPPEFSTATEFLRSETIHLSSHLCWNGCEKTNIIIHSKFFVGTTFLYSRNFLALLEWRLQQWKDPHVIDVDIISPNEWNHTHLNWHVMPWISLRFEIYSHAYSDDFTQPKT